MAFFHRIVWLCWSYIYFPIVHLPFICSNIPAAPTYAVYISQLIRYSRACGSYQDFLDMGFLLTKKLLSQGFLLVKLKSSLRKCYGRHHDLVAIDRMEYLCHKWLRICSTCRKHFPVVSSFRNCLPFRSTWVHPRFLERFVLLDF